MNTQGKYQTIYQTMTAPWKYGSTFLRKNFIQNQILKRGLHASENMRHQRMQGKNMVFGKKQKKAPFKTKYYFMRCGTV